MNKVSIVDAVWAEITSNCKGCFPFFMSELFILNAVYVILQFMRLYHIVLNISNFKKIFSAAAFTFFFTFFIPDRAFCDGRGLEEIIAGPHYFILIAVLAVIIAITYMSIKSLDAYVKSATEENAEIKKSKNKNDELDI